MKRLLITIFSIFILSIQNFAIGQEDFTPNIIPPSPEAAALGKFGDIPVGKYTGIPSINIPLHTLQSRDISVPISLSYHASGIKVEEEASWVGLGWALNAGGVITRSIKGNDDFLDNNYNQDGTKLGFIYSTGGGALPVTDDIMTVSTQYVEAVCRGDWDSQPDVFFYNLNGVSGRFISNQKSNVDDPVTFNLLSQERIKIEYKEQNSVFTITNNDGFKYVFGSKEYTDSKSKGGGTPAEAGEGLDIIIDDPSAPDVVTAWYLDEIISPIGQKVTFAYSIDESTGRSAYAQRSVITISEYKETPVAHWYVDNDVSNNFFDLYLNADFKDHLLNQMMEPLNLFLTAVASLTQSSNLLSYSSDDNSDPNLAYVKSYTGSQTISYPVYLEEISFPNGSVVFHTSKREDVGGYTDQGGKVYADPQKLDSISIYSGASHEKSIVFSHSYFNYLAGRDDSWKHLNSRLKLDQVLEYKGTEVNPGHKFSYNEMSGNLPVKNSYNKDYWGYYNKSLGQSNATGIPTFSFLNYDYQNGGTVPDEVLTTIYGANRDADLEGSKAAILTSIEYPTGGRTDFDYELNKYVQSGDVLNIKDEWILFDESGILEITHPTEVTILRTLRCNSMSCYGSPNDVECEVASILSVPYLNINEVDGRRHVLTAIHADYNCKLYPGDEGACQVFNPTINDCSVQVEFKLVLEAGKYNVDLTPSVGFSAQVIFMFKQIVDEGEQDQLKSGGGLRIAKITSNDMEGNSIVKRYNYSYTDDNGIEQQGKLMSYPNVFYPSMITTSMGEDYSLVYKVMSSTYSNRPLSTAAQGAYIGYDRVTEIQGDNGGNGKTVSYYKNKPNELVFPAFPNTPSRSYSAKNGLLEKEEVWDDSGNLLNEKRLYYDSLITEIKAMHLFKPNGCIGQNFGSSNPFLLGYNFYNETSEWWYVKESITNEILDGFILTTNIDYNYDNPEHRLLTRTTQINSEGEELTSYNLYPQDYSDNSGFIGALKSNHIFNTPIEMVSTSSKDGVTNVLSSVRTTYNSAGDGLVDNIYVLEKSDPTPVAGFKFSNQPAAGTLPFDTPSATFDADFSDFDLKIHQNYDNNKNLVEVIKKNYHESTYVWGYNNSLPFIKAQNVDYTTLELAVKNAIYSVTGSHQDINLFTDEIWDLSNTTQKNLWLAFNSVIRNDPSLNNSMITSYTYNPLVGISSVTDPNGIISYYEYDELNRLKLIKDEDHNIVQHYDYHYKEQ